ncbi:MAG: GGDEF domain-containing protein [Paraglaciecola sp.]|nr:GGDEF domain-containing protein [Paraglaciecola sp.]
MDKQLVENIQYRRDVLRVLTLITFLGSLYFGVLNFYREIYTLAGLELVFGFFSIVLWQIIPTTEHFSKCVMAYIIPAFLLIIFALLIPQTSDTMFVWILTIPLTSYLLMGRRRGFWVSVVFILLGVIAYHWRFMANGNDVSLNMAVSVNISLSSILIMSIAHVYEVNREKNEQRLIELAGTDKLTGLANRMKLDERFQHFSSLAKRHKLNFILVLFDIDFFKKINDQHGHNVGDQALCFVADFINNNIRETDFLARYGGEEFSLLMTSSDIDEAHKHIDLIRERLSKNTFLSNTNKMTVTLSAGLATYGIDGTSLDVLMKKADDRLYLAKNNGRNCIVTTDQIE